MSGQAQDFRSRLARLEAKGPMQAGVTGLPVWEPPARVRPIGADLWLGLGYALAPVLGAGAMIAGLVTEFCFFGSMPLAADPLGLSTMFFAPVVMALTLVLGGLYVLGWRGKGYAALALAALAAVYTQEYWLASSFPEIWAQLYSQEYLDFSFELKHMARPVTAAVALM